MPNGVFAGVAVDDLDLLDRHAELVRHELGEGRLVALAVAVRAGQDLDVAGRVEPELRRLPQADTGAQRADHRRRRDAAGLDVGGEADAAQLAARLGLGAARLEALVVGDLDRLVEDRRVVAAVVLQRHRRLVREGVDGMKFFRRSSAGSIFSLARRLARRCVSMHEGRLGPSGAAIGVDRRGVGERRLARWRRSAGVVYWPASSVA